MADEIKLKAPTVEQQVVVNINGEDKLKSFADTLDKISNNKNLQKYWKTQQDLINATADAYGNFQKKASKDNASELIKVTNALKAMSGTDLSHILPDFDKISKSMSEAQKVAGNIDSAFSVKGFKEAFDSFETLKAYGTDVQKLFSHFGVSSDIGELQQNVRLLEGEVERLTRRLSDAKNANEELRNEFENFKVGSGFADKLDELDRLKAEMQNIRDEATQTFNQFLDANKIDRYDWFSDDRFAEYFEKLENGTLTATDAIRRFKSEYSYLLEDSYKSNGDSFGLDQLQVFSTKFDSIFHQVEETSNKINDILSNGVIAKSVQNLSEDTTLSDSQRSIFGNILQDEESLKSITALFQKLIDETNQTKNTEVFNTEQFTKLESLFRSIESSLSSIKGVLVDVGDGEELSPLLKQLDNIREATSNIKLSLNLDLGNEVSERLNQKVSQSTQRQLEAYRKLFSAMKGTGKTNKEMLKFFEPDEASATELIGAYQGIIKRAEEKFKVGNSNVYKKLLGSTYDDLKKEIKNANAQLGRAENKRSENGILGDLFGNSKDLSGVIEQLNTIVSKLDEISVSAKGFTETLKNGLNVNASVDEIEKLTNRVKELESELAKIKTPTTIPSKDMKDAFPDKVSASVEKIADGFKEVKQETEEATESAKDYVRTISQVGEWNVDSKVSVVKERNDGQLETWNYDAKRGKKDITYDKDGNINYGDPIITTISNYKQLEQTIVKADDKLRDLRKALEDIKEINPNASTKNIEKQIQYQKEYISLLEQTVKMISQGDEYFLNEQQIIDARKKATTEYDLKQGTKSDISNAKQSAKANEQAIRQEQKLTDELRKQEEQARKTALSYTESASKKLSDAISKYSYGDSSDATAMMKQMNRGLSNFGDLSSIESNIKNFDSIVDAIITDLKHSHEESLSALNNEIKAEETMQKQKDAFNKSNLNAIDVEIQKREEEAKAFSNSLKAQMESQQQAESQMSKLESTLSKYQTKKDTYDATIARFNDGGWTSDTYLKNVQAVKDAVKKYEDLLSDIKAKGGIASEEDIQNLKEYEAKIKDTIATVTNMSAAEKGYNFVSAQKELDKIHKLLNENSKMSSEAKNKIRAYYAEIESGNPSMSLDRIHGEIMKIYNAEVEAGRAGRSFFDTLKNSGFHQLAAQMAGMFGVYDVINVVRQGVNTVRELDEAMTEVHKVSNATETQYASFRDTISSTAKEIATTNKELLNSSADFLRLGYSLDQASDLAKNATLFVNVGDGVDITEATEDMITAMKAFDIQAKDSIKIVDDYNQIGNQFALSASDIGEAMKRSASALETGNNSFEQSIGLITAMNEIVQNSENTGNSLKVLSLRLRGAKAELEDMQEDTDGLCDSTSKLREQIKSLTGVDIMLDDNTFKSTTDIIKELGAVWDKLSDSSQAATLELIAGKSRANNVAALLKNYQKIDEVMESLGDAEGSAMRENEAIVDSINGRIKVLSATAEEFWQKFIDTDLVKELVSLASDLLNILTKIVNIGNGAGTLGLIGAGTGIFKFIKNFDWVFKPYIKTLSNSF